MTAANEILREQAQWRHGRTPIMDKYADEAEKLMGAVAARGFLSLPGFAFDAQMRIETEAKAALSDLNYKILAETIDRELKQAGIDYDIDYRDAVVAWEIEKQALLNDWEIEHAGLQQGMMRDEEILNRLEIQVNARGTYLLEQQTIISVQAEAYRTILAGINDAQVITAKTAIEIEAEAYRKAIASIDSSSIVAAKTSIDMQAEALRKGLAQLSEASFITQKTLLDLEGEAKRTLMAGINDADIVAGKTAIEVQAESDRLALARLDAETAPYEASLATAKLQTAQRKLALIPTLQKIVGSEQQLIVQEKAKADASGTLAAAEKSVSDKSLNTLAPAVGALVHAVESYQAQVPVQAGIEKSIAAESPAQAEISRLNATQAAAAAGSELQAAQAALTLQAGRQALSDARNSNEKTLMTANLANVSTIESAEKDADKTILDADDVAHTYSLDKRREALDTENTTRVTTSGTITGAEIAKIQGVASDDASTRKEIADINAAEQITAKLTHLIG